jgi:hypothetical protein
VTAPLPFHNVTGFLGAGKTTLIGQRSCGAGGRQARIGFPILKPACWRRKMDKETAAAILSLAKSTDEIIGNLYSEVEKIIDADLKSQLKEAVGDLMRSIARDFVFPIERLHPELKIDD